jgi:dihydroorotate dehydrogenase electron transfer subunit
MNARSAKLQQSASLPPADAIPERQLAEIETSSQVRKPFWFGRVTVLENRAVAEDTYLLRLEAPEIARRILPGQFLMLRLPETVDPLLGRAFALYDVVPAADGPPSALEIGYQVVGKMSSRLKNLSPGAQLEAWGPLGNGFPVLSAEHWILVAGGIGVTPFFALSKELLGHACYGDPPRRVPRPESVTLCYGVRRASFLLAEAEFRQLGVDVRIATEDGSSGVRGLVTDVLPQCLEPILRAQQPCCQQPEVSSGERPAEAALQGQPLVNSSGTHVQVVACGPEPMLAAVAHICQQSGVPCLVSLESPMACGFGICFSCAVRVRVAGDQWDYVRACVEGPVFPAEKLVWD